MVGGFFDRLEFTLDRSELLVHCVQLGLNVLLALLLVNAKEVPRWVELTLVGGDGNVAAVRLPTITAGSEDYLLDDCAE